MHTKHISGDCDIEEHVPPPISVELREKSTCQRTCGTGVIGGPRKRPKATGVDLLGQQLKGTLKRATKKTIPPNQIGNAPKMYESTSTRATHRAATPSTVAQRMAYAARQCQGSLPFLPHRAQTTPKVLALLGNAIRSASVPVGRIGPHHFFSCCC